MKKFSVSNEAMVFARDEEMLQIGLVPGEFDTKQIVLCVMAMMSSNCDYIKFVRTLDNEELKYCRLFITDAFASSFPSIPVYNSIDKVWIENYKDIVKHINVYSDPEYVLENSKEDLYNLENFDILRRYNKYNDENKGFEKAIKLAYELIKTTIQSVAAEHMYVSTINLEIEKVKDDVLKLPLNSNWRNALKNHLRGDKIQFVIVPESDNLFRVECVNQSTDVRKIVKGYRNLVFSGRFFAKVNSLEHAYELIELIISKRKNYQIA